MTAAPAPTLPDLTPESAAKLLVLRADGRAWPGQPPLLRVLARCQRIGECWEYQGFSDGDGYGQARRHPEYMEAAHRIVFTELNGPLPTDVFVCHTCDNPPCCNPDHLFAGTAHDNYWDCRRKGRMRHGGGKPVTHCKRGHAFDDSNTRVRRDGSRTCLACERARRPPPKAASSTPPSSR